MNENIQKNGIYLKYKSFVTSLIFIVTDQLNASLMNKSITFLPKNNYVKHWWYQNSNNFVLKSAELTIH